MQQLPRSFAEIEQLIIDNWKKYPADMILNVSHLLVEMKVKGIY